MQKLFKNTVLSIVLTIALVAGILYGAAMLLQGSSSGDSGGGSNPESNNDPDNSTSVVDFSELTYVAFGDSITFGADYTRNYAQMDEPYPKLVAETLKLASVNNLGVSGATFCSNSLDRVCMTDRIIAFSEKADIISVMLGVNDWYSNLPLGSIEDTTNATIYGCLNLIAKHLTTTHKDSFVFFMTPYQTTLVKEGDYALTDVAKAIKEVALIYGIPVLDMYNVGRYELEMYNEDSDGIHPSQEFMKQYTAPQITAFIKSNYK